MCANDSWFWEEDDKTWHAYNPGDSDILETIYRYVILKAVHHISSFRSETMSKYLSLRLTEDLFSFCS